jgi:hypothetical protein
MSINPSLFEQNDQEKGTAELLKALSAFRIEFTRCDSIRVFNSDIVVSCSFNTTMDGDERNVVAIDVAHVAAGATLNPLALARLTKLQALHISGLIAGTLPSTVGLLTDLEELLFTESSLGGSVPSELANLRALKTCDLGLRPAYTRFCCPLPPLPPACTVKAASCNPFFSCERDASLLSIYSPISLPSWYRAGTYRGTLSSKLAVVSSNITCAGLSVVESNLVAAHPRFALTDVNVPFAFDVLLEGLQVRPGPLGDVMIVKTPSGIAKRPAKFDCILSRQPLGPGVDRPFELLFFVNESDCLTAVEADWAAPRCDETLPSSATMLFRFDPMSLAKTDASAAPTAPSSSVADDARGAVIGASIGAVVLVVALVAIVAAWWWGSRRRKRTAPSQLASGRSNEGSNNGTNNNDDDGNSPAAASASVFASDETQYIIPPAPAKLQGSGAPIQHYAVLDTYGAVPGRQTRAQAQAQVDYSLPDAPVRHDESYGAVPGAEDL